MRITVLNPTIQTRKFVIHLREHLGTIHQVEGIREVHLQHNLSWIFTKLLCQPSHSMHGRLCSLSGHTNLKRSENDLGVFCRGLTTTLCHKAPDGLPNGNRSESATCLH